MDLTSVRTLILNHSWKAAAGPGAEISLLWDMPYFDLIFLDFQKFPVEWPEALLIKLWFAHVEAFP